MKYVEPSERELFLLLFYRERVGRLVQRLRSETGYMEAMRRKRKKATLKDHCATAPLIAEWLASFIRRAEDDSRCNDICKSMYFCDLPKGHRGHHGEWCFDGSPMPKKAGGPGWLVWPQERKRAA